MVRDDAPGMDIYGFARWVLLAVLVIAAIAYEPNVLGIALAATALGWWRRV